jgi:hypothetical protein
MFQNVSDLISPGRQKIDPTYVPYSNDTLAADLRRLENTWEEVQSIRKRKAIYSYLTGVFELIAVWEALGQLAGDRVPCFAIAGRKSEVGVRSSCSRDFLLVGSGKSRPKDPEQMVKGFAVRGSV